VTLPTSLSLSKRQVTDLALLQKGQLKIESSVRLALGCRLEGVRLLRLPIAWLVPARREWLGSKFRSNFAG
jgi:hypothetical protein